MARKSRKHLNSTGDVKVQAFIRENALPTAAYIRLSVENSGQESDETLQMQMKLVHLFIQEHHELSLADTYIDNGATGTNFERKEFLRMMEDVKRLFGDGLLFGSIIPVAKCPVYSGNRPL